MRRLTVLLSIPLLATVALAGCGSSPSTPAVSVTGTFAKSASITIPDQKASSSLTVKTLIQGKGPTLSSTDSFVGDYAVYLWRGKTHKLEQSTYKTKSPAVFVGRLLPGLETAVRGKRMGSRILAVVPPADGYGKSGNPQAGIKGTDTLVFVVDMIKQFGDAASGAQVSSGGGALPAVTATPGSAPVIKVSTSATPPSGLVAKVLIKGSGAPVTKGQTVVAQYVGVIWRTGKVFDSSWARGEPFEFTIGATPSQVIPGWDSGLIGQTVGSRVMLVIPPADGYGKTGSSQAGIKGTDTLVFVVDILDALTPG
jgi:FKBP-type peptidyl-prolyl cis-trans isomerase